MVEAGKHEDEAPEKIRSWSTAVLVEGFGNSLSGLRRWREAAETFHEARVMFARAGLLHHVGSVALHEGIAWRHLGECGRARECLELAAATDDSLSVLDQSPRQRALAELELLPADRRECAGDQEGA